MEISPGIDEVLSKTDISWGSCDGDLTFWWAFCGIGDFDLGSRHLPDFINFGPLASNYAAY